MELGNPITNERDFSARSLPSLSLRNGEAYLHHHPLSDTAMDSSPISTADPQQPASSFKLRLLCSYGGHIIPRPHDKSLVYSGGETHIVGIDRRTVGASLSYLTSHLSKVYYNNRSFVLKYLLPDGDLDALISVTNDDDLQIMIEEQDRLAASPNHTRIRLFLFPSETVADQKAEAWFLDALRSVSITQRGKSVEPSLNSTGSRGNSSDTSSDVSSPGSASEAKYCSDLASVPETMVLETSSSIGSNGSSASNPNIGLNDIHTEETGFHSADYKIISPSPGSFDSENSSLASILTPTQSPTYHDPVPQVQSMGTLVFPSSSESGGHETQYWVQTPKDPSTPSCTPNLQSDQSRCQQQEIHYISASPSLVSQYPSGPFYPVYYSAISPQQQQQQQQNQHPLYLSSVRSTTQVYNVPMQCSLVDTTNPNSQSGSSIHHSHATVLSPSFTYKEVGAAIIPTELSAKVYLPVAAGSAPSHFHMASNQTVQPPVNVSEMASHPNIAAASAAATSANVCDHNDEDDLLYTTTMYKTQPSAQLVQQYYAVNQGAMGSRQTNAEYSQQHKIANLQM